MQAKYIALPASLPSGLNYTSVPRQSSCEELEDIAENDASVKGKLTDYLRCSNIRVHARLKVI